MKFHFKPLSPRLGVSSEQWASWQWQFKNALTSIQDFQQYFELSPNEEEAFVGLNKVFQVRVTPYYAHLAGRKALQNPVRKILMPKKEELVEGVQQMFDPLAEKKHSPTQRIIHRYPDRCLLLVTDFCSVYCRYCTRKHFTGKSQAFIRGEDYKKALQYIEAHPHIREVILSGGDPLTLSSTLLERVLFDLRKIPTVEIIRIGTRIPVVAPMRINKELVDVFKKYQPIYLMLHFNHPKEITEQAAEAILRLADSGIPMMNQMVLLNGINNHEAIVQALSRRLLYLRVKPYYMFQCDPSLGSDHLRTSVEDSLQIQKKLWGRLSGLAMPNLSLDIPDGGGKVGLTPNYLVSQKEGEWKFKGWDGVEKSYLSPVEKNIVKPADIKDYEQEWLTIKNGSYGHPGF